MSRSRAFDEPALLDAAVELFWAKGFDAASLAELTARTGVTNGSLYQAYGTKWGVFMAAFRVYCDRRVEVVAGAVEGGFGDVEQALVAYYDAIVDDCLAHPDRRGCLMLNTISTYGTHADVSAISSRTIDSMEAAVAEALRRVAPVGTADPEIVAAAAQAVALSQALIQLSRMGRGPEALREVGRNAAVSAGRALAA